MCRHVLVCLDVCLVMYVFNICVQFDLTMADGILVVYREELKSGFVQTVGRSHEFLF